MAAIAGEHGNKGHITSPLYAMLSDTAQMLGSNSDGDQRQKNQQANSQKRQIFFGRLQKRGHSKDAPFHQKINRGRPSKK